MTATSLPRIIGITGNIAAGKSTVSQMLRNLGHVVVDADHIAKEVVRPGTETYDTIIARFGSSILDDTLSIDRNKLKTLVFNDDNARQALERIMHPAIEAQSIKQFQLAARNGHDIVFYDAALLIETGRYKSLNGVLLVTAPDLLRKQRLMARDGLTDDLAVKIMSAQLDQGQKAALATWVIVNDGSTDDLSVRVQTWLNNL